jgi:prepilin-type N-terminal cleavage/methylation domain-containing protein
MLKKTKSRGFTLIELLVVIAIIGLLASIVLVNLAAARIRARDSQRIQNVKQLRNAVELYYADNGHYPLSDLINSPVFCDPITLGLSPADVSDLVTSANSNPIGNCGLKWSDLDTVLTQGAKKYIASLPDDLKQVAGSGGPFDMTLNGQPNDSTSFGYGYVVSKDGQSYDIVVQLESNTDQICSTKNWLAHTTDHQNGVVVRGESMCAPGHLGPRIFSAY